MSQIQQQQEVGQKKRTVHLDITQEQKVYCGFNFHKVETDGKEDRSMYYIQALCLKENCPQKLNGVEKSCYDLCIRCLTQKHKSHDKIPLDRLEEFINKGLEEDDNELEQVKKSMRQKFGAMKEKVIQALNALEEKLEEQFQEMASTNNFGEFWNMISNYHGQKDRQFYNELGKFSSSRIKYNRDADVYELKQANKLKEQQSYQEAQAINDQLSKILKNAVLKLVESNKITIQNKKKQYEQKEVIIQKNMDKIQQDNQYLFILNIRGITQGEKKQQITKINQSMDDVLKFQEELNTQWESARVSTQNILIDTSEILKQEDLNEINTLLQSTEDIVKSMIDNLNSSMITLESAGDQLDD